MENQVVIAGAGPVGLAVALGLARCGIRSIVVDSAPGPSEHSRAVVVWARTMQAFESWGIIDRFVKEANFIHRFQPVDVSNQKRLLDLDFGLITDLTPLAGALSLPQDATERLLREAVLESGFCELRWGHELTGAVQRDDRVIVSVRSDEGAEYQIEAPYLVGCDGAHSRVRGLLGWNLEGTTYPRTVSLYDVSLPEPANSLPWPRVDLSANGLLGVLKFQHNRWRIIDGVQPVEGETIESRTADRVRRLFGDTTFETVWASDFHIHNRITPAFRKGRVFLAGDAAHLNSPAGGMGMNGGIQDAVDLSWKLGWALSGKSDESILETFNQERRYAITHLLNPQTDRLTQTMLSPGSDARRWVAHLAAQVVKIPLVARRAAIFGSMLNMHYAGSDILPRGLAWVGTIMPDLSLSDSYLYEHLYPDAVLLLFDSDPRDPWAAFRASFNVPGVKVLRIVRPHKRTTGDFVRAATDEQWWKFGTLDRRAMLIRPDGFIGWQRRAPTNEQIVGGVKFALKL